MDYLPCPTCGGGPGFPCQCRTTVRVPDPFRRSPPQTALPLQIGLPPPSTGWTCPRCTRVWGPHIDQCRSCSYLVPMLRSGSTA